MDSIAKAKAAVKRLCYYQHPTYRHFATVDAIDALTETVEMLNARIRDLERAEHARLPTGPIG